MGSLASVQAKEAKYEVLRSSAGGYIQIRRYAPHQVARTEVHQGDHDSAFRALAEYIGVWGHPRNSSGRRIPMTKPVLMYSSAGHSYMEFILPGGGGGGGGANPAPTNTNLVEVDDIPEMLYAVVDYNRASMQDADGNLDARKIEASEGGRIRALGYAMDTNARQPCMKAAYSMPILSYFIGMKVWIPVVPLPGSMQHAGCCLRCGLLI